MMVGNRKQRERAADNEGSNKEGKGGKGNGDVNEDDGHQRGQGQQGQWQWKQGWQATKRVMATAARAMVTTWAMATATRRAGSQEGMGKGSKNNCDGDEGARTMATATRVADGEGNGKK
jgi:hypothetical protein